MEDLHVQQSKRQGGVDFTLGIGRPDPDPTGTIPPARVHLRQSMAEDGATIRNKLISHRKDASSRGIFPRAALKFDVYQGWSEIEAGCSQPEKRQEVIP